MTPMESSKRPPPQRPRECARQKKRRDEARRLKLCQVCPSRKRRPVRPGKATCLECHEQQRRAARRRTRDRARRGLCDRCGREPRTVGIHCQGCRDHRKTLPSAGRNVTTERRRAKGVCRDCGERTALDTSRCSGCRKIERDKCRARRAERIAAGLCACGKRPPKKGHVNCGTCLAKKRLSYKLTIAAA